MSQYYGNGSAGPGAPDRFERARYGRVFAGLCMSLAMRINIDVSLVRIITVVLSFATSGTVALIYLIAWVIVPEEGWSNPSNGTGQGGNANYNAGTWNGGYTGSDSGNGAGAPPNNAQGTANGSYHQAQGAPQGENPGTAHQQPGPEGVPAPPRNDAIIFGGILLLLGGYLLLNHLFGSIFHMRYFLPLALMSVGVYIIYRATGRKD